MNFRDLVPWSHHNAPATRRDVQDPFESFHREVDRLFEDFFSGQQFPARFSAQNADTARLTPHVDVVENDKAYAISAELPGIDEKDVDVTLADGVLTLTGEKKTEVKEGDDQNPVRIERSYGRFQRSFTLPNDVDSEAIKADFDKGVLKLTLPKLPEAQDKSRKIQIGK